MDRRRVRLSRPRVPDRARSAPPRAGCRPGLPTSIDRALRSAWRAIGRAAAPRGPLRTTVEHYDLGNRFFQAWLDGTMTYSSALFERDGMTLEEAQLAKYRRIADITGLRPGMRVLEIGSGWGGFARVRGGRDRVPTSPRSPCRRNRRRGWSRWRRSGTSATGSRFGWRTSRSRQGRSTLRSRSR